MSRTSTPPGKIDHKNRVASLPVSAGTNVGKLAGATWKFLQEGFDVDHVAVGAGAINQSMKALATARNMAKSNGVDMLLAPTFETVTTEEGRTVSALRLFIVTAELPAQAT